MLNLDNDFNSLDHQKASLVPPEALGPTKVSFPRPHIAVILALLGTTQKSDDNHRELPIQVFNARMRWTKPVPDKSQYSSPHLHQRGIPEKRSCFPVQILSQ